MQRLFGTQLLCGQLMPEHLAGLDACLNSIVPMLCLLIRARVLAFIIIPQSLTANKAFLMPIIEARGSIFPHTVYLYSSNFALTSI